MGVQRGEDCQPRGGDFETHALQLDAVWFRAGGVDQCCHTDHDNSYLELFKTTLAEGCYDSGTSRAGVGTRPNLLTGSSRKFKPALMRSAVTKP